jgi:lactate permease
MLIIGLAYLYNYSGMSYTLGLAISTVGAIFPFFSVFLGWIACFLSGSDTSSNALFGNLQVVAARQLNLSPVLMAASNSSGAVMSKMISPQNVTTGVSTTELAGKEGLIIRRTFMHSIILAAILGAIVMLQQYVFPGIIPH